ncbi:Dps family protein [Tsukamurella soli]|uniref:DNA starvation/stationary phase protection protein n=1 Tax=Tsukamurella soli TaxID=644556 RepID=A0ABP8J5S3_9ACTN
MATTTPRGAASGPIDFTVPGLSEQDARSVITVLQDRLNALSDLVLTLKHVHWNVVGPHFIAVHTMLDDQVEAARSMVDQTAERIAAPDVVYVGVIEAHRRAVADTDEPDPVSQDMLIGQCRKLEQAHWFVRAHLENSRGTLSTGDADTEKTAASRARS